MLKKRRGYRFMKIEDEEYQFFIGKSYIVIYSSTKGKLTISKEELFRTIGINEKEIYVRPMFVKTYLSIKYHNGIAFTKPYKCEYCGKKKDDVVFAVDPYGAEILNRRNKYFGCEECFNRSAWEI